MNASSVKEKAIIPGSVLRKKNQKLVSVLTTSMLVTIAREKTIENGENGKNSENSKNGKNNKNGEYLRTNLV